MKKRIYIAAALGLLGLSSVTTSCDKFLDVQPTGTMTEDKQFSDMQGFYDALYGVYGRMATTDLYGGEMSYRFVDKIGQMFCYQNILQVDPRILAYNYTDQEVRTIIDKIWSSQYEAISFANNIIEQASKTRLSSQNIPWVKGEALGLRAFLHFDLVRLFADRYQGADSSTRGLPYSQSFDLKNKTLYSLFDTYRLILEDLDEAERLLSEDETVTWEVRPSENFRAGRVVHFNKYAVYATKARVYYTMGDYTNAARYARMVIESSNFALASRQNFATTVRRFPASREMIFGLHNRTLSRTVWNIFSSASMRSGNFTEARRDLETVYKTSSFTASNVDLRYTTFYEKLGADNTFAFRRLISSEAELNNTFTGMQGFVLIRLPEMYYILAESLYQSAPSEALAALNAVRASRGLVALSTSDFNTFEAFQMELRDERQREMPGEGQYFYSLKYYNRPFYGLNGGSSSEIQPSREIFVLPWPERELEYGDH